MPMVQSTSTASAFTAGSEEPPSTQSRSRRRSIWSTWLLYAFFAINLFIFYFIIIPHYGSSIATKCSKNFKCYRHIAQTSFDLSFISSFLQGWKIKYNLDNSDGQWRELRGSMKLLWLVMIGVYLLRLMLSLFVGVFGKSCNNDASSSPSSPSSPSSSSSSGGDDPANLTPMHVYINNSIRIITGVIFLYVLHGEQSIIIVAISFIGYIIAIATHRRSFLYKYRRYLIWIFAISILLFKESYRLLRYPYFKSPERPIVVQLFISFLRGIDQKTGLYSWKFPTNFLVLRIISFSCDIEDVDQQKEPEKEKEVVGEEVEEMVSDAKDSVKPSISDISSEDSSDNAVDRTKNVDAESLSKNALAVTSTPSTKFMPASQKDVISKSIFQYFLYILFAPLYLAGPIISYRDFYLQARVNMAQPELYTYAMRWILCFILMEYLTHKFPFFAVVNSGLFSSLSIPEVCVFFYFTLKLMWLKFLLIWRFFRLWSLSDLINPQENMTRCMSNLCSLEQFWKNWHCSFNKWIVQYMYVPMGGKRTKKYSVWPIFLFVALWHDIEFKLLVWAMANSIFYLIESYCKYTLYPKLERNTTLPAWLVSLLGILGSATYIMVLIAVNTTGYSLDAKSVSSVTSSLLLSREGAISLVTAYWFMAVGVAIMTEIRQVRDSNSDKRKEE